MGPHHRVDLINAGGQFVTPIEGMSYFSSVDAFAMIRGGHVDLTVLGAFQVAESGDLANWFLPERGVGNVGGAMDLAAGAKRMIVVMEHTTAAGEPKIVRRCAYPVTGLRCVDLIVTDIAVIESTEQGLLLREVAPGWTAEDVQRETEPDLLVSSELCDIQL